MAGPGGKEIGRLTVRVLPDTDGFREAVQRELSGYEDIKIGMELDPDGFRQQVAAAVKAAETGQEVNVPVEIDNKSITDDLAKALKVAPDEFQIKIDKDRLKADFKEIQNDVQVTPALDMGDFERRMKDLLKPVELPIEADFSDQSIKRELDRIDNLGKLEIPMGVDTSGFSKEALQARAEAAKILEKNQIRLKLDAQDDELRQKLARARAELTELNELGVSPKYDGNALRQAQSDLERVLTKLNELQKKKTFSQDQEAEFAKLKIDLDHAWTGFNRLKQEMDRIGSNPALSTQSKYAEDLAKKTSDAFFKAHQLEKKIRDIESSKADPKIDWDIADALRKADILEGRIRDMKALGGSIQYQADVDQAIGNIRRLESESARVTSQKAKIDFEVDTTSLENARRIMRETSDNEVRLLSKSFADAKTEIIQLGNEAGAAGSHVKKLGIDAGPTGTKILEIGDHADSSGRKLGIFRTALSGTGSVLAGVGTSLKEVGSGIFSSIGRSALTSAAGLSALAAAAGVAGAAVAAAWGAIATAIAAVNPAIALAGLGFATVSLGMDGIKRAAATLNPELQRLKANVSGTFENRLTPVFAKLKTLFDDVLFGTQSIAIEMSNVGNRIADVLVNAQRLGILKDIFSNVENAIKDMGPGIEKIVSSMLRVMQLESGFKALSGAVDAFGASFDQAVKRVIADGSLNRAFEGLGQVLNSLSRAFVGLVTNGLQLFAGAAPGVSKFMDSITGFFERFNWERLGRSVGKVFDGLGTVFDNVPDSTIENITKAFEGLGEVFQNPEFQRGLGAVIDNLPAIIDLISQLTLFFSQLARIVANVAGAIDAALKGITNFGNTINDWLQNTSLPQWMKDFLGGMLGTDDNNRQYGSLFGTSNPFKDWTFPDLPDWLGGNGDGLEVELDTKNLAESVRKAIEEGINKGLQALNKMAPASTGSSFTLTLDSVAFEASLNTLLATFGLAMINMHGAAIIGVNNIRATFQTGFAGLAALVQQQMALVEFAFLAALLNMQLNTGVYLEGVRLGFQTAFQGLALVVQTQMALVMAAYLAALTALQLNTTLYLQGLQLAFLTAFVGLAAMVTQQMALVQFAYLNALTQMQLNTGIYLLGIQVAFQTMFSTLAVLVTTQMALVQFAFLNALLQMQLQAGVSLLGIQVAFQTAFANIAIIVMTQMAVANAGYLAALFQMALVTTATLATIQAAFLAALFAIVSTISANMALANVTYTNALVQMLATTINIWNQIRNVVVSSMAAITAAIAAGMAASTAAVAAGTAAMVAAFVAGMAAMVGAARAGMAALLAALSFAPVISVVAQGVSWIVERIRTLDDHFHSAGDNAVRALADAIRAGASAVISAASWVATQAINAAKWALGIKSPSREFLAIGGFMMAGWSRGVDKGGKGLVDTVRKFTGTLIDEAYKASEAFSTDPFEFEFDTAGMSNAVTAVKSLADTEMNGTISSEGFGGIEERVENALSGWSVEIDQDGMAKLVNKSNTRKARRR